MVMQGRGEEKLMVRALIGSRPPICERRCMTCGHCEAVQVPVIPRERNPTRRFWGIATLRGDYSSNYKPLSWKCKCGNRIFNPWPIEPSQHQIELWIILFSSVSSLWISFLPFVYPPGFAQSTFLSFGYRTSSCTYYIWHKRLPCLASGCAGVEDGTQRKLLPWHIMQRFCAAAGRHSTSMKHHVH